MLKNNSPIFYLSIELIINETSFCINLSDLNKLNGSSHRSLNFSSSLSIEPICSVLLIPCTSVTIFNSGRAFCSSTALLYILSSTLSYSRTSSMTPSPSFASTSVPSSRSVLSLKPSLNRALAASYRFSLAYLASSIPRISASATSLSLSPINALS